MKRQITVSDHAIVRYLERVKGVDLEAVRAEIAAIVGPSVAVGARSISRGGYTYRLDGSTVVTILWGDTPSQARTNGAIHRGKSVRMQRADV